MKLTQIWIATAGALALAFSTLHAEPGSGGGGPGKEPGNPEKRRAQMMERLQQELGLTPEQVEKIEQAGAEERAKVAKLREDTSLTREQKIEAMRASRHHMDEAIREVLTPEQQAKFDKMIQERKEKARELVKEKKETPPGKDKMKPVPEKDKDKPSAGKDKPSEGKDKKKP
jgi:Spy/CpxP family protein refolding chaperone